MKIRLKVNFFIGNKILSNENSYVLRKIGEKKNFKSIKWREIKKKKSWIIHIELKSNSFDNVKIKSDDVFKCVRYQYNAKLEMKCISVLIIWLLVQGESIWYRTVAIFLDFHESNRLESQISKWGSKWTYVVHIESFYKCIWGEDCSSISGI